MIVSINPELKLSTPCPQYTRFFFSHIEDYITYLSVHQWCKGNYNYFN